MKLRASPSVLNAKDEGPSDEEVVRQVLEGLRDDYAVLVRRYQERFYRFALGMVAEADVASDLVQDSLVKAYTNLRSCRDPSQFGTWAFQILRNGCRDYLKNLRRSHISLDDPGVRVSASGGPDEDLHQSILRELLQDALASLPTDHREAFLLKHLYDYRYGEIAEMLQASTSAVKMRVHRARETLRSCIETKDGVTGDVTLPRPESSHQVEAATMMNPSKAYVR